MLVTMLKTAAGPDAIYDCGKTYNLPSDVAKRFLAVDAVDLVAGKPEKIKVDPAAKPADRGAKVTRVPAQPDPEDRPELVDEPDELEPEEDDE